MNDCRIDSAEPHEQTQRVKQQWRGAEMRKPEASANEIDIN